MLILAKMKGTSYFQDFEKYGLDILADENIGYNRQPIKFGAIFIQLGMQNEQLNPKSITEKEIPDYHNFLFCEKCSEFYYGHKIQPFTLFSLNKMENAINGPFLGI